MTAYADLKVAPFLRDVLEDTAEQHYEQEYRAISRAGHEAAIAWLLLVPDDDTVTQTLTDHGFDGITDLVSALEHGRFEDDDRFDPLQAVRTPTTMPPGDDIGGWPNGLYLVADTPPTAYALDVEDGTGDTALLADVLDEHGIAHDINPDPTGGAGDGE